jgi:hypothetical protein
METKIIRLRRATPEGRDRFQEELCATCCGILVSITSEHKDHALEVYSSAAHLDPFRTQLIFERDPI